MNEHVNTLLGAYMDGELDGQADKQVRTHLAVCKECQKELSDLKRLSGLLRDVPKPVRLSSASQFAARVNLRLPDRPVMANSKASRQSIWWLIPILLLSVWVVIQIASLLTTFVLTSESVGYLGQLGDLLPGIGQTVNQTAPFTAVFSGLFGKESLSFLDRGWSIWQTMGTLLESYVWSFILALMYLAWLVAVWHSNSGLLRKSATSEKELSYG